MTITAIRRTRVRSLASQTVEVERHDTKVKDKQRIRPVRTLATDNRRSGRAHQREIRVL
jgi:hypothetical protein